MIKLKQRNRPPKVKRILEPHAQAFLEELKTSNLSDEAFNFVKELVDGNRWMREELEKGTLTIARLRKLFKVQGSEKVMNRKPRIKHKAAVKGHGRNAAEAYQGAEIVEVSHPTLSPGDICPAEECDGRLYEMSEPGVVVRVTGAPLATATRYSLQKLRCAVCEVVYTAPLPPGVSHQKYDASFVAMLMINKYFMSIPFYRQDRLQNYLGMPLPSSTQWDLIVAYKDVLQVLYEALCVDAANGDALCYDDTSVKVLTEIKAKKAAETGQKKNHTCFTTGLVSLHPDHHTYIYMTDNHAGGYFMGEILKRRDPDLDLPILMCDALSSNIPQEISDNLYILCYCLVHARRQFYELPSGFDDLADEVIRLIGNIYDNEAIAKDLNKQDRLAYHKEHSKPVMDELKDYLEERASQEGVLL